MAANSNRSSQQRGSGTIGTRPEEPRDQAFLFELYASTRQEELDAWGWPPEMRALFLKMQFAASQGYHTAFPTADFQIVVAGGQDAGRLAIDLSSKELRVVDIALLPQYRNGGIGSALLQNILAQAAAIGLPVRLCVRKGNRAERLYSRLGFVKFAETELHLEMEWRPSAAGQSQ
jgi:ribosomal protein S18 acetylase RimI-like enzyme